MFRAMKRLIPTPVKELIRSALRDRALRHATNRLRELPDERLGDPTVLMELRAAFGNLGFSGDCDFLSEVARRAAAVRGPVLECGSGVSTIVLGLLGARHGWRVISLEQDAEWHKRMQRDLRRLQIGSVDLRYAPLRDYGDYEWYDVNAVLPLPGRLEGVFCDGPFAAKGYRRGLLPTLTTNKIVFDEILCDDGDAKEAPSMLKYWTEECGASYELLHRSNGILIAVRPPHTEPQLAGA